MWSTIFIVLALICAAASGYKPAAAPLWLSVVLLCIALLIGRIH